MRLAAFLAAATLGSLGACQAQDTSHDAPETKDNPRVVYKAELPEQPFWTTGSIQGNVRGYVRASQGPEGKGVRYKVKFENLPTSGGPFIYHVHVNKVPSNGNCTETLAHLDPYARGEATPCDSKDKKSCQVGDLSGKHGSIEPRDGKFEAVYEDLYSSLVPGSAGFIGNRSLVVHFANKTRITCADFGVPAGCPAPKRRRR